MELDDFLHQIQSEVQAEILERLADSGEPYPYPELIFAERVMQHMHENGMTFEPQVCHYEAKVSNARLKLSGFALSDDADQLDLFVSIYDGAEQVSPLADSETKAAAEQCLRFLAKCAEGKLTRTMEEAHDAYVLAATIERSYNSLEQIRIYVVTDKQCKSKTFKTRDVQGKAIKLEVMDIERLNHHLSEGKPRDELVVNFEEVCGGALPCVYVSWGEDEYDYALTAIPGEALRFIYEKYGARLLEANVRSFLNTTGKVNKGIKETLQRSPKRFMAYNNGIVIVADEARVAKTAEGGPGITWLKGMQIVNGGQTTASLYFSKKKTPSIDLSSVRIPAKIIILRTEDQIGEESLISDISRFANSQNSVKQSDLSANKPFHVEIEKLSMVTYCPDGIGRWFYERAAGSYNTMLAREGTTPVKLRHLKQTVVPPGRKFTKTDLAMYVNAWAAKPHLVTLGSQKNFERFMEGLREEDGQPPLPLPDVATYKGMIAQGIVFKKTTAMVLPMFPAFQRSISNYLIAVTSIQLGEDFRLDKVWAAQDISDSLRVQLKIWAKEVHHLLHASSKGRMISEWAKKPECWETIRFATFSAPIDGIFECT